MDDESFRSDEARCTFLSVTCMKKIIIILSVLFSVLLFSTELSVFDSRENWIGRFPIVLTEENAAIVSCIADPGDEPEQTLDTLLNLLTENQAQAVFAETIVDENGIETAVSRWFDPSPGNSEIAFEKAGPLDRRNFFADVMQYRILPFEEEQSGGWLPENRIVLYAAAADSTALAEDLLNSGLVLLDCSTFPAADLIPEEEFQQMKYVLAAVLAALLIAVLSLAVDAHREIRIQKMAGRGLPVILLRLIGPVWIQSVAAGIAAAAFLWMLMIGSSSIVSSSFLQALSEGLLMYYGGLLLAGLCAGAVVSTIPLSENKGGPRLFWLTSLVKIVVLVLLAGPLCQGLQQIWQSAVSLHSLNRMEESPDVLTNLYFPEQFSGIARGKDGPQILEQANRLLLENQVRYESISPLLSPEDGYSFSAIRIPAGCYMVEMNAFNAEYLGLSG